MNKWDRRFLDLCNLVGSWSKDPKKQVGAVIVDSNNRIISVGFNGLPKGVVDSKNNLINQNRKLPAIVHAEINAILFAKTDLTGCILYVSLPTCTPCSSVIIQSGISKVIYPKHHNLKSKWVESNIQAKENYIEAGINVIEIIEV